jgi:hypothetical protein
MTLTHFELTLSSGRDADATKSLQTEIIKRSQETYRGILDPEKLLYERKTLREEKKALESNLKRLKISHTKSNKKRDDDLKRWNSFVHDVVESAEKYQVDFREFPRHLARAGTTFKIQLQHISPDTFVEIGGMRINQKKDDSLLDDVRIKLFEAKMRTEILEDEIKRKAKALKAIFDEDLE